MLVAVIAAAFGNTTSPAGQEVELEQIVVAKGSAVYFIDLIGELATVAAERSLFRKIDLTCRPK